MRIAVKSGAHPETRTPAKCHPVTRTPAECHPEARRRRRISCYERPAHVPGDPSPSSGLRMTLTRLRHPRHSHHHAIRAARPDAPGRSRGWGSPSRAASHPVTRTPAECHPEARRRRRISCYERPAHVPGDPSPSSGLRMTRTRLRHPRHSHDHAIRAARPDAPGRSRGRGSPSRAAPILRRAPPPSVILRREDAEGSPATSDQRTGRGILRPLRGSG